VRDAGCYPVLSCEPLLDPLSSLDLAGIDWVVGGESGPEADLIDSRGEGSTASAFPLNAGILAVYGLAACRRG
jgi:hypothetical protein